MVKKLAKLEYFSNNFKIIENGDYVICAVSGKEITLENLNYWSVELQEPYFSYVESHKKRDKDLIFFIISICYLSISIVYDF